MSWLPALDPVVRIALRGGLALLFVWAAVHKLRDVGEFRRALTAYELLPQGSVAVCAGVLMVAETGIAAALLLPAIGTGAALAAACLLTVYAAAIGINLWRGRRHIDCGCVGAAQRRPLSATLVARNGVLIVMAIAAALPAGSRALVAIDGVTIAGAVVALALLYVAVDGLLANAPRLAVLRAAGHALAERQAHEVGHA